MTSQDQQKSLLSQLLAAIPEGSQYDTLRYTLIRIAEQFPDKLDQINLARVQGWVDEIDSGTGRDARQIRNDIFRVIVTKEEIMRVYGVDEATADAVIAGEQNLSDLSPVVTDEGDPLPGARGDEGEDPDVPPGVMSGGELILIDHGDDTFTYAVRYVYNGATHIYTFASKAAAEAAVGREALNGIITVQESAIDDDPTAWILGPAEELGDAGDGSYQDYMDDVAAEAAEDHGARDPGRWARLYQDPQVQALLAAAEAGDWSDVRLMAEIRLTDIYQELYPGANTLAANGSTDPEGDWRRYYDSVEQGLEDLGYERDADGTYDALIGEMIEAGITEEEWMRFVPTFVRAEGSPEYMEALNKWVMDETGAEIKFDDWFDVLEGTTTAEMDEIVERATLQYRIDRTKLALADEQIERLAELTQLSEREMAMAFSTAEQALLSIGDANLARYGLSEEALVNAQFRVETEGEDTISTREGPLTAEEIRQRARKAATELGIQDDTKRGFFLGFDEMSRPVRRGLAASRPEMG